MIFVFGFLGTQLIYMDHPFIGGTVLGIGLALCFAPLFEKKE